MATLGKECDVTNLLRALAVPRPYPNAPKPFSFDPVFAFLNPGEMKLKSNGNLPDGAISNIAHRLGVDRITIHRWRQTGLDDLQADVVATRLDVHPSMLWDNWFDIEPPAFDPFYESFYDPVAAGTVEKDDTDIDETTPDWVVEDDLSEPAPEDEPWHLQLGACRGVDPHMFFPERGEDTRPAKAVCFGCQVREECLQYALATRNPGIWGGTSDRDRRRMRRELKNRPLPVASGNQLGLSLQGVEYQTAGHS